MKIKRILTIGSIVILILGILNFFITSFLRKPSLVQNQPGLLSPTPIVYYNITPGAFETDKLTTLEGYLNTNQRDDFAVYEYRSHDPYINNEILVKDGGVALTANLMMDTAGEYAPIENYFKNFGETEKIYYESYYGFPVYAWPSKGFAVSGSRGSNQAFRTYQFEPTSIENFEKTFASEFKTESHPRSEGE